MSSQAGRGEGTHLQTAEVVRRSTGAHPGRGVGSSGGVDSLRLSQWRPLLSTDPTSNDSTLIISKCYIKIFWLMVFL